MAWVHAAHDGSDHWTLRRFLLKGNRGILKVHCDCRRQHFDMTDLLGRCFKQHVPILFGAAVTPSLKEILQAYADFSFYSADSLLQHLCVERVGGFDAHWKLKT